MSSILSPPSGRFVLICGASKTLFLVPRFMGFVTVVVAKVVSRKSLVIAFTDAVFLMVLHISVYSSVVYSRRFPSFPVIS